jgi:hypothetical protein
VRGGTGERPWVYFGGAAQGTPEKGTEA